MNVFKTIFIFIGILFLSFSIFSTAKEVDETDYSSDEPAQTRVESGSEVKEKFEYNKTYGPSPMFTIGGGFSASRFDRGTGAYY